jgi:uncharacterized membrane protein YuzA (DUF378 family)
VAQRSGEPVARRRHELTDQRGGRGVREVQLVAELFGLSFGETNAITRIVYGLVGVSGVYVAARAGALMRGTTSEHRALA